MKKLLTVIMATLALNFLAVAGGVGWLYQNGKLTHDNMMAVKEILFPKPKVEAATQPTAEPTSQPFMKLEELLAKASGRSSTEQVEFIQHTFDSQMALLDRRQREIVDLQRQVELSKQQMVKDRATLDAEKKSLESREKMAAQLATDKGFQDSLALYNSMPASQVKRVFAGLDDQTVINYLQSMQPRTATKIIKEFQSPEETERIQRIMEKMRLAQASLKG